MFSKNKIKIWNALFAYGEDLHIFPITDFPSDTEEHVIEHGISCMQDMELPEPYYFFVAHHIATEHI